MIVYDVVPAANAWVVRIAGDSMSEAFASKAEAVARARVLAQRDEAMVRVRGATGEIETEYAPPSARH